jgi:hypothetical protein
MVFDLRSGPGRIFLGHFVHTRGDFGLKCCQAPLPTKRIDRLEFFVGDQPRSRIRRQPVSLPNLHGGCVGLVHGIVRQIKIVQQADE